MLKTWLLLVTTTSNLITWIHNTLIIVNKERHFEEEFVIYHKYSTTILSSTDPARKLLKTFRAKVNYLIPIIRPRKESKFV